MRPSLDEVLAAIMRGRIVRLSLSYEQRQAFRDRDGRIALDVLRHVLGAPRASGAAVELPLTDAAIQRVAGRLGHKIGIKRAREMRRRLIAAGVIQAVGSYRRAYTHGRVPSGFRVGLHRLSVAVAGVARRLCDASHLKASIGRGRRVKRRETTKWWEHPLFGNPDGLPPPDIKKPFRRRMRSLDQREWAWR